MHPALQRHEASDEQLDHPAAAGSVSIRVVIEVSDFRPGQEIRVGGSRSRSISEDKPGADLLRKSQAKRRGGALGGKLPTRLAGSHHCSQPTPSETAAL